MGFNSIYTLKPGRLPISRCDVYLKSDLLLALLETLSFELQRLQAQLLLAGLQRSASPVTSCRTSAPNWRTLQVLSWKLF